MKFIGRQTELETLEREYQRDSGFVVLYGRRRVGKTTLMKEFIRNKTAFYFLATQETESQSMKRFAGVLARATGNRLLQNASFSDWADLFQAAADYKPEEKKVLVIDEFPYLVKTNPAFPSLLQSIWDEQLKDSGMMLILCGSLIGMMKKYALSHDSPLYGRRTAQIRLMPLSFPEVRAAQQLPFAECVTQYAVTGGVPKYMEFFQEDRDFTEQLREVVLSRNGFLYEEPQFLFSEEIQSPVNYFSILKTVADGNRKPSKIGSVLGMDSSTLSPYLATLMELGFLTKQVPITEKNPERSRKGLYEISDNFIRFWFRYVYPYKGELELDNQQIVLEAMAKDFTQNFVALAYEPICRSIFAELCRAGKLDFTPSKIGAYWLNDADGDTEIDVAAVDQQHRQLFLGECKYYAEPVGISVYRKLVEKAQGAAELHSVFDGYDFRYAIFSKSGFTQELLDLAARSRKLTLILDDDIVSQ